MEEKGLVGTKGLEPSSSFERQNLNLLRLPVSPHPHLNSTAPALLPEHKLQGCAGHAGQGSPNIHAPFPLR
jgi:hypothetical protein